MAQTKTKKAKKAKPIQLGQVQNSESEKRSETKAASQVSSAKSKASPQSGQAVGNAGKDASHATGQAVSKARVPLLAGGAALAGTVGGVVLGATRSGGKVLGVKLPEPKRVKIRSKDLAKAAKEVGRFGENVGDLTTELKRAREGLANGDGGHNSPIEVLLKGLTHRR